MTFNEFLNTEEEDSQKIFEFYLEYLAELSSKDFPFNEQLKLKGAGGKFINSIDKTTYINQEQKENYLNLIDDFQNDLRKYRHRNSISGILQLFLLPSKKTVLNRIQDSFQKLYSSTLELINESAIKSNYYDELNINDFYKPNNSNKQKIKKLINEAMAIIRDDNTLTEKTKNIILDYLKKALKELARERVNWTKFLGRIKETIIILGALGSFAAGASTLFEAQEKLEQTTVIIQKTSVNLNFNILQETFNVQYIKNGSYINNVIELPETNNVENHIEDSTDTKK